MRTTGKQCGLAPTGDYQPSLRSPWLAAGAGFLEQALHIGRPGIVIGVDDEGELAQQVRTTQPMAALV
ncbi:hypothetical protein, partial [Thiolapillus sp.]|uniref:hypothetical protein n=1 Tax=Thiolapillus sp. TaxID=2017437 RepID=UPI0025FD5324